ncbi:MAG: hypothetical protein LBQ47_01275 [Endomicrobium sp.]|jgi:hypothetical protein|nr:hypothetical protein [Endomicrobium sp.]
MYIDFVSDWPAYIFMVFFAAFVCFVVVSGNRGGAKAVKTDSAASSVKKK